MTAVVQGVPHADGWMGGRARQLSITTEGGSRVLANLQRKADQADQMFSALVEHMNQARAIDAHRYDTPLEVPQWLTA